MFFNVDKNLNYGREVIADFSSKVSNVGSCLDVGAGHGSDLSSIRRNHLEAKMYGIEFYDSLVEELKQKDISPIQISFENSKIPLEDESLDLVLSNQVMEHCKEVFWVMHEKSRVLKVGGHLLIGVPNLASLHNRFLLLLGRQPTNIQNNSAHLRGFTKRDLIQLLDVFEGGYELVDFAGSNFYPFSPFIAKPMAKIFPNMAYSIFLLLKKKKKYNGEYLKFPVEKELETNFFLGN